MIADPALARQGPRRRARSRACIGCNQGCIGHYHAGVPIACTSTPGPGFERTLPPPAQPTGPATTWSSSAPARPGAPPPHRPPRAVTGWCVFERGDGSGRPDAARAARARASARSPPGCIEVLDGWLAGVDVRYGAEADAGRPCWRSTPTGSSSPPGPGRTSPLAGDGVAVVARLGCAGGSAGRRPRAGERLGRRLDRPRRGRDAGRRAASAVRLVSSAVAFGENVHVYQRNLYLDRLDDAGVVIHPAPAAGRRGGRERRRAKRLLRPRRSTIDDVDTLVVSAGRTARNTCSSRCRTPAPRRAGGRRLGPRSFEEAIGEGTLAGARA